MLQSKWLRSSLVPMFFAPLLCGQTSIGPDFLVHQEGSPLQVVSIALPADGRHLDLLERVTLANVGEKPIARYTLGWVVVDDATRDRIGPFVGRAIEAKLSPGEMMVAPPQGVDFETMLRLARGKGFNATSLIVGVVQIIFTDGSQWNYPLMQEGQFHERRDPAIEEKLRPIRERHRRTIESLAPHQEANCGGGTARIQRSLTASSAQPVEFPTPQHEWRLVPPRGNGHGAMRPLLDHRVQPVEQALHFLQ